MYEFVRHIYGVESTKEQASFLFKFYKYKIYSNFILYFKKLIKISDEKLFPQFLCISTSLFSIII